MPSRTGRGLTSYMLVAAAAAVWIVVSFMLFSAPAPRWIVAALAVPMAAAAMFRMQLPSRPIRFSKYHTPIVEALLQSETFPIVVLDHNGTVLEANEAAPELFGYSREELLGKPFEPIVDTGSSQQFQSGLQRALAGSVERETVLFIQRTGFPLELQVIYSPIRQASDTIGILLLLHDLSDHKRNLERIRYMAYYDDMTGLPNRTLFHMKLADVLESARQDGTVAGICYLDLDRFKLVNASFGREFGDMLLLHVAERLTRFTADHDRAARLEGDEFAVIFAGMNSEEELQEHAQTILKAIEEPFELKGFPIQITASMGISTNRLPEDDSYSLLKKADIALIKVKENGKNDCLFYSEDWSNSSMARLTLQHEMYRAIQRKEFVLMYQPQYDLATGAIIGAEALVRWNHPERGIVSPSEFISLAEESGMIVQIGDWVLEEACRQNKEWQDSGLPPIPISVNLSLRQFMQRDLAARIAAILDHTGLEPKYLDLEITESMTMDLAHVARCLVELTNLGVGISVDDFGTGYSSFHYLKNFPIDRLKIDRSFVRDIQQDPSDAEIVAAIIAMAHSLDIQVIAEGVETEAQMAFLKHHNCDEMQGYYWSPPVSSRNIEQLLSA
ncbi:phosphodiesterase [Paenibacillus protaetiae]|uniref:Phosphodiesterase n=2 Tax=Paenibacillus protaetiae TaxID=2509456 RepID=A0A4V0YFM9_9BACL|nr:phosphodiesterase [Paenibacillus protaetiae]